MKFPSDILRRCWFLAGPTASGKTAVSLRLAERIGAEIVAMDSMTLYREMDIGTAKPTAEERAQVPHHLFDIADPADDFSVAEYLAAALPVVIDILGRNRVPLFVGGTGLYLRSLLRGVFEGPPADWTFRRGLEVELAATSPEALHGKLAAVDAASAARLHPNDVRRVIRALEIVHLTGQPASELHDEQPLPADQRPQHVVWLNPDRERLHEQINCRVDQMMQQGLLAEVTALLQRPRGLGRTARQALGYKELLDHLEGREPLSAAVDAIKTRTRQFAKRQCTWFRNLEECRAVEIASGESVDAIVERITG